MFKIGDQVKVVDTSDGSYTEYLNCTGTVKDYKKSSDGNKLFDLITVLFLNGDTKSMFASRFDLLTELKGKPDLRLINWLKYEK